MLSLPYTKLGILYNWHTHRSKYISIETTFQFNKETSTCIQTRAHKNERERKRVQLPERPSFCAQEQNLHLPSHILFLCCTCSPHLSATSAELRRPEHVLHSEWHLLGLPVVKKSVVYWLFIHSLIHKCSWYSISMNPKLKHYSVHTFTAMVRAHTYTCSKQEKQTPWHSFSCLGRVVRYSTSIINSSSTCLHTSSLATTGRVWDTPIVTSPPYP